MVLTKARKVGLIAVTNLVVGFALLTLIELACRHWEQARIERHMPAELRRIPPKGPSEIRVFAFGGSTVFGAPVPEVAFVAQVQYWLHRLYPNRNIRVYNFGYPAVDTAYVLRQLTRRLDDQPDLVIVATGVNDFFGPHHGRIDRLRYTLRLHFATMRLLGQFDYAMMRSWQGYIMPCQVDVWDQESASYKGRIATFNEELNQIVKRVRQKGVPLILCTLPSNLSDWPPVYKRLPGRDRRYIDAVSRIQELLRGGKYQEASDAVTTGFSRYPQDAMLYFLRGQIQAAMGAYADARESFVKARDLDPEPYPGIQRDQLPHSKGSIRPCWVSIWLTWKERMRNTLRTVWSAPTWWPTIITEPRSGNRSPRRRSFKKWSKSAFCLLRRSRRRDVALSMSFSLTWAISNRNPRCVFAPC